MVNIALIILTILWSIGFILTIIDDEKTGFNRLGYLIGLLLQYTLLLWAVGWSFA